MLHNPLDVAMWQVSMLPLSVSTATSPPNINRSTSRAAFATILFLPSPSVTSPYLVHCHSAILQVRVRLLQRYFVAVHHITASPPVVSPPQRPSSILLSSSDLLRKEILPAHLAILFPKSRSKQPSIVSVLIVIHLQKSEVDTSKPSSASTTPRHCLGHARAS